MRFRQACGEDITALFALAHKAAPQRMDDVLFTDWHKLEDALVRKDSLWLVGEWSDSVEAVASLLMDRRRGLCKITRLLINPDLDQQQQRLRDFLYAIKEFLTEKENAIDSVYTTTLSMPLATQEATVAAGFKIFGVFPNLLGADSSRLNGLTACFLRQDCLDSRPHIKLHPHILAFFKIAQQQVPLEQPEVIDVHELKQATEQFLSSFELETPDLELIDAAGFVEHRFNHLQQQTTEKGNFYPFYKPNVMLTDPEHQCEIYVKIVEPLKFAAVICEHFSYPVCPIKTYQQVQKQLYERGVRYIEIINDAADHIGTECIMRAGFTPCAYFPALMRQGQSRRDFVVFGRSFEYLCRPEQNLENAYRDFYREYFRIEGKKYFPDL